MDRLPFTSEDVLSEGTDTYPASHEGVFHKLFFYFGIPRCVSAVARFSLRPRRSSPYGRALPCKPHIRREDVPTTVPYSGRESSRRAGPLCEKRRMRARPDNGDAPLDSCAKAAWRPWLTPPSGSAR